MKKSIKKAFKKTIQCQDLINALVNTNQNIIDKTFTNHIEAMDDWSDSSIIKNNNILIERLVKKMSKYDQIILNSRK